MDTAMPDFPSDVLDAAAHQREVRLTTYGRNSGKPRDVTIWAGTDGKRLYIRSGEGMRRHWPQNLVARGEGVLHLGNLAVEVKPRLVTDATEARMVSALYRKKYGPFVKASKPDQPLTEGEKTTFEILPA